VNLAARPPSITSDQGGLYGRHSDGCNVAFLDGRARWLTLTALARTNERGDFPYFTKILD
jgi:prepilin-type processing-associated H-X9-DG protein